MHAAKHTAVSTIELISTPQLSPYVPSVPLKGAVTIDDTQGTLVLLGGG